MNLHLQGHWSDAQQLRRKVANVFASVLHFEPGVTNCVLAEFLPVHGHGRLPTVDAVFPQAIEFSDHAVSFPEEVDAAEEGATAVVENSLQLR